MVVSGAVSRFDLTPQFSAFSPSCKQLIYIELRPFESAFFVLSRLNFGPHMRGFNGGLGPPSITFVIALTISIGASFGMS